MRSLDFRETTPVGSDGFFSLTVDYDLHATPTGLVIRSGGDYFPAYWFFGSGLPRSEVAVRLLPRTWEVRAGEMEGERIPLQPEGAFGRTCAQCPVFWSASPDDLEPPAPHWPAGAFPIPVALDRQSSTHDLTASDSLELWESIGRIEAVLGKDLFRPAQVVDFERVTYSNLGYQGLVTVRVAADQELSATGVGHRTETGVIDFGTVGINRPGAFSELVTRHELLHTLGVEHTCGWPTLLLTHCSTVSRTISEGDVAHIQVFLEQTAARESAAGIFLGFRAAFQGLRFERDSL